MAAWKQVGRHRIGRRQDADGAVRQVETKRTDHGNPAVPLTNWGFDDEGHFHVGQ